MRRALARAGVLAWVLGMVAIHGPLAQAQGGVPAASGATPAAPAAAASPVAAAASAPPAAAPVSVTLAKVQRRDMPVVLETTGTVTPLSLVEIKPQMSGQVVQTHVREGEVVRQGQLLFTLDARAEQANLAKARAQLLKDEAALADAQRQLTRSRDLLERQFVSQGAVDSNLALLEAQQAAVAADKAAIAAAEVALSYSRISAPVGGRVGALYAFTGSSVSPAGPALITITQMDPIAVTFSIAQLHMAQVVSRFSSASGSSPIDVQVSLPGAPAPGGAPANSRRGRLSFIDSSVDAASGTVKVKGSFPNADQSLWPGAYVTVRLTLRTLKDAVVVPQASVVQGARGLHVFVVNEEGIAAIRPVQLRHSEGVDAVVDGLKPGERVVLEGRQNVRPGSRVIERGRS